MTVVRWDPFRNVNALQDRINRMFEETFPMEGKDEELSVCAWRPVVDIYESDKGIVIKADLPGVRKEDVAVEVKNNILSLKGERHTGEDVSEARYYRRERCFGTFMRSFTLRSAISPDKIKARFKEGVLTIEVPGPEEEKPKQVTVNVE